jgi:hemerythrin-like domain-containing protein
MNLLHASPAAGFDEPFELMAACHERMERTLTLLERIGAHVATHGCDEQARDAAKDVLRYFTVAAPLHHEDEELHVLPRLREQGNGELADRLLADHREMETRWAEIVPDLEAIRDGSMPAETLAAARERWQTFAMLYRRHIDAEDHDAYPAASAATPGTVMRVMGEDMAARRRA